MDMICRTERACDERERDCLSSSTVSESSTSSFGGEVRVLGGSGIKSRASGLVHCQRKTKQQKIQPEKAESFRFDRRVNSQNQRKTENKRAREKGEWERRDEKQS